MPYCLLSRRSCAGVQADALPPAGAGRGVRAPHPRSAGRACALRRTGLSSALAGASGVGGGTVGVRAEDPQAGLSSAPQPLPVLAVWCGFQAILPRFASLWNAFP